MKGVYWLWKEWANVLRVRNKGVPIVGFTWYSLTDQMDWDSALRENNGRVNPLGLYDLDRKQRPVSKAYQELISEWREVRFCGPLGRHYFSFKSESVLRISGDGMINANLWPSTSECPL